MEFLLEEETAKAKQDGVDVRLDYVAMNDPWTFETIEDSDTLVSLNEKQRDVCILSGALWIGKTRLIDNILLGNVDRIVY